VSLEPSEWVAPLPRGLGDRLRAAAPAVLLAVVAIVGVRNHIVRDQSSWEGASYGMFATYENHVSRLVVVTVTGPDGSFRAAVPEDLADDARRLRVAPSQGAVDRLAAAVAERVADEGATEVEVALWRIALDEDDGLRLRLVEVLAGTATT